METSAERRILAVGGILWIVTGVLGIVASNVTSGLNPLFVFGPILLGFFILVLAFKGRTDTSHQAPAALPPREKHA